MFHLACQINFNHKENHIFLMFLGENYEMLNILAYLHSGKQALTELLSLTHHGGEIDVDYSSILNVDWL